jgi:phosphatidate cytidylyltransferase
MLRTRVLTAIVGVLGLIVVVFLLPSRVAVWVYSAAILFAAWEWSALARLTAYWARAGYVTGVALLMALASQFALTPAAYRQLLIVTAIWWLMALLWLVFLPQRVSRSAAAIAGALVLVPAWTVLTRLHTGSERGPWLVFYVLCLVWAADSGAYFAGRRFGHRRLAPLVSPGKTWEGVAGGLAGAALVAAIGAQLFDVPTLAFVLLGCAVALVSVVGDLTESMFKRFAGLKDSGNIIPGHGGLLDRIDSLTAAVPLFVLGLAVLGSKACTA